MTADKVPDAPGDIEALLPWYAIGRLDEDERRRVEAALEGDAELKRHAALAAEEMREAAHLNELLGAPSRELGERLFAAIDAEAAIRPQRRAGTVAGRLSAWLGSLQPRTLGFAAAAAALIIVVQAAAVATLATGGAKPAGTTVHVAAATRAPASAGTAVLIGFQPTATAKDIDAFLAGSGAAIVDGPKPGGLYRVRISDKRLSKDELARRVAAMKARGQLVRFVAAAD
jgi:anti-sigma-K factor RskA